MKLTTVDTFLNLVQIDSPSGEEQQVAEYLIKWLKSQGFTYHQDKIGNTLAFHEGKGEPLLFCAHMDTVKPGIGIKPIIEGDMVKSSGETILGADNKAAIAAIMHGVAEYLKETSEPRSIEILFAVKEESGGGVEKMNFKKIKSKKGIIFDLAQPIGAIALASPYITNISFNFIGKTTHSSRPDKGKSALRPAAEFVTRIEEGYLDQRSTTINMGKINGGTNINAIPGEVLVSGEVRSFDQGLFNQNVKNLIQVAQTCADEVMVRLKVKKAGPCTGYAFDKKEPFIQKIAEILAKNGHKVKFVKTFGISDSNPLVAAGIKVVTLGDGVINPHENTEQISVKSLEDLTKLVTAFCQI